MKEPNSIHRLSHHWVKLEQSLITLQPLEVPYGFEKVSSCNYPKLLSFFFKMLFNSEGLPLYSENICRDEHASASGAVFFLRQVLLACSKLTSSECMQSDEEAQANFVQRISYPADINLSSLEICGMRKLIHAVFHDEDGRLDPTLIQWVEEPFGRHGPGAVAQKEKGGLKWDFGKITGVDPKLYKFCPTSQPFSGTSRPISRFSLVPKDFRKKRVICIEPKEFQFAQQGLMNILYDLMHRSPLTKASINFRDQSRSQSLAREYGYATIDLKDASDSISLRLCRLLLPKDVFAIVTRYRSRFIKVGNLDVRSACFASMGSALCFPIQTLIFWAIARSACDSAHISGHIRVFGDDIIIPEQAYDNVTSLLGRSGFRINHEKSCCKTPVRESCGAWYFGGYDCAITRLHTDRCASLESWLALVEAAKALNRAFLPESSLAILDHLNRVSKWTPPYGLFGLPNSPDGVKPKTRLDRDIQQRVVEMPCYSLRHGRPDIPQDMALYAWLVGGDTRLSQCSSVKEDIEWVITQ